MTLANEDGIKNEQIKPGACADSEVPDQSVRSAVCSGHPLSAARIIGYYRMYQWGAQARMKPSTCAGRC